MNFDIGPDVEVEADKWEAEQQILTEMQIEQLNSCDALRVLDGVPMAVIE